MRFFPRPAGKRGGCARVATTKLASGSQNDASRRRGNEEIGYRRREVKGLSMNIYSAQINRRAMVLVFACGSLLSAGQSADANAPAPAPGLEVRSLEVLQQ